MPRMRNMARIAAIAPIPWRPKLRKPGGTLWQQRGVNRAAIQAAARAAGLGLAVDWRRKTPNLNADDRGYPLPIECAATGFFVEPLSGRHTLGRTLHRRGRLICQKLLGIMPTRDGLLLPTGAMAIYREEVGCEFMRCRLAGSVVLL